MESVFRVRAVIKPIEDVRGRTPVMNDDKLRRVEKTSGSVKVDGHEVACVLAAVSESGVLSDGAEGSVRRIETAGRLVLAHARTGDHIDHKAVFVAIPGRSSAGSHLHRLNRLRRQLRGKGFALLIRDLLIIDHER